MRKNSFGIPKCNDMILYVLLVIAALCFLLKRSNFGAGVTIVGRLGPAYSTDPKKPITVNTRKLMNFFNESVNINQKFYCSNFKELFINYINSICQLDTNSVKNIKYFKSNDNLKIEPSFGYVVSQQTTKDIYRDFVSEGLKPLNPGTTSLKYLTTLKNEPGIEIHESQDTNIIHVKFIQTLNNMSTGSTAYNGDYNIDPPQPEYSIRTFLCYGKVDDKTYCIVPNFINMYMMLEIMGTNGSNYKKNPLSIIAVFLLFYQVGVKTDPFNIFAQRQSQPVISKDKYIRPIDINILKTDLLSFINSLCP